MLGYIIAFVAGTILGGVAGALLMAVSAVGKIADEIDRRCERYDR